MPALCAGVKEFLPFDKGCGIEYIPPVRVDEHHRRWVRIARLETESTFLPFAHHDCSCNQITSLRNRVLGVVPAPTKRGIEILRKQARRFGRLLPHVAPDDWYVLPDMYTGSKRARYLRATDDVLAGGLTPKSAQLKLFVKFEKLSPAKVNPDPRAIQFRDAKYCVALGRYLKPVEHVVYRFRGDGKHFPASRLIGKGLSQAARAKLLVRKFSRFVRPVVIGVDARRFDLHVSLELLQIEHSVYMMCLNHPEFQELLNQQLRSTGVTSKGIRYSMRGRRASGDFNTASGNCILMVLMCSAFLSGKRYELLDDGDDCLILIEEDDLSWLLANIGPAFLEFGMEIKVESVARTLEHVLWCQSRPIQYEPGKYKFVRDPWKVLSTAMSGVKYVDSDKARRKLINTIGMAELVLNLGVPVLQEFATAMMRNAATPDSIVLDSTDSLSYKVSLELKAMNLRQLERLDPRPITDAARESFAIAFNISVEEQLELEEFLANWAFSTSGAEFLTDDYDVATWQRLSHTTSEAWPLRE